jgi:hypothetical protein
MEYPVLTQRSPLVSPTGRAAVVAGKTKNKSLVNSESMGSTCRFGAISLRPGAVCLLSRNLAGDGVLYLQPGAWCSSNSLRLRMWRVSARDENRSAMEQSLARAHERIVKLESQVEQMRTALSLIYEISQDRITPVWEVIEHIAATAKHALHRNAE